MTDSVTVRELAGAIGAELSERMRDGLHPDGRVEVELLAWIVDTTMGVIARYVGSEIVEDVGMPVEPIPRYFFERMKADNEEGRRLRELMAELGEEPPST